MLGHNVAVVQYINETTLCGTFWSPQYRKDAVSIERVQKGFTSMLPVMEDCSYKERLDGLGLSSLEHKRLRICPRGFQTYEGRDRTDSQN